MYWILDVMYKEYCADNLFDFVLISVIDCQAKLKSAAHYSPYLLIFRRGRALAATDAAISRQEIKGRLSLSAKSKIYSDSQGVSNKQILNMHESIWMTTLGDVDNLNQHAMSYSVTYKKAE